MAPDRAGRRVVEAKILQAAEVHVLFADDPAAHYVDVRTVAEFVAGHPRLNGVNVPIQFVQPYSRDVFPNDGFVAIMQELYPKDARLVVGCDNGERARLAAAQLCEAGYANVSIMSGGLSGWRAMNLPVSRDNRPGTSYVSLLTRVRRTASEHR